MSEVRLSRIHVMWVLERLLAPVCWVRGHRQGVRYCLRCGRKDADLTFRARYEGVEPVQLRGPISWFMRQESLAALFGRGQGTLGLTDPEEGDYLLLFDRFNKKPTRYRVMSWDRHPRGWMALAKHAPRGKRWHGIQVAMFLRAAPQKAGRIKIRFGWDESGSDGPLVRMIELVGDHEEIRLAIQHDLPQMVHGDEILFDKLRGTKFYIGFQDGVLNVLQVKEE